jgi:hypothetical protein
MMVQRKKTKKKKTTTVCLTILIRNPVNVAATMSLRLFTMKLTWKMMEAMATLMVRPKYLAQG